MPTKSGDKLEKLQKPFPWNWNYPTLSNFPLPVQQQFTPRVKKQMFMFILKNPPWLTYVNLHEKNTVYSFQIYIRIIIKKTKVTENDLFLQFL